MISIESTIVVKMDQISSDLLGEVVILDLRTGLYYGLDEVGARVWNMVQRPQTVSAMRDAIAGEYDVDPDRCEKDLIALLNELHTNGLIKVEDDSIIPTAATLGL